MHLAALLQSRQISSLELTKLYLERLEKFDSVLKCVVTPTEGLALRQAKQADAEIAAGNYRGRLDGIPWGAKDLIAKSGYPTTWGAPLFKDRVIDADATVVKRLEEAGAVLVAKLATGELAHDDVWFGGQTKNPWYPREGSGAATGFRPRSSPNRLLVHPRRGRRIRRSRTAAEGTAVGLRNEIHPNWTMPGNEHRKHARNIFVDVPKVGHKIDLFEPGSQGNPVGP